MEVLSQTSTVNFARDWKLSSWLGRGGDGVRSEAMLKVWRRLVFGARSFRDVRFGRVRSEACRAETEVVLCL